jgi:hypothetical protein
MAQGNGSKRDALKNGSVLDIEAILWATADKLRGNLGDEPADSFHRDLHKDLKADYILANGSMFSNQSGEGETCRIAVNVCSLTA